MSEYMRDNKKRWLLGTGLALGLGLGMGCLDFQTAYDDCVQDERCAPPVTGECNVSYPDVPDDEFFDSNCDGIDGNAADAIFVDAASTKEEGTTGGSKDTPFRTLSAALNRAAQSGQPLYVAAGEYTENSLRLERAVSIYGGYAGVAGDWKRGTEYKTKINGVGTGLAVAGLGGAVITLDRLTVNATTVTGVKGAPCVAMRVVNSTNLRLRSIEFSADKGSAGAEGVAGSAGLDGGNGLDGGPPNNEIPNETPLGGLRGPGSCGDPAPTAGNGGNGGSKLTQADGGQNGAPGVAGGAPGALCPDTYCPIGVPGSPGGEGRPGDVGTDGPEGEGRGEVTAQGVWSATSGERGTAGLAGTPGGGGGGGSRSDNGSVESKGGGGGGGGAAGCGGGGGQGGQGGGAEARGSGSDRLTGGNGGKGGKGGNGGNGGRGGGGGGGPSVGIWCERGSSFTQQKTFFTVGDPGAPGAVDSSKARPVPNGQDYNCTPAS